MEPAGLVAFMSDYGLGDPFVGLCHAVIAEHAPQVRVVDLTHGIAAQDVQEGAVVLADTIPWLPRHVVVLAVVDPGVGTTRRPILLTTRDGPVLVGPDNGLLMPAAERAGGVRRAVQISPDRLPRRAPARTFDGRDVFAPAAAHLAGGGPAGQLGPAVSPQALVTLAEPAPLVSPGRVAAQVVRADRYGNVLLGARAEVLDEAGLGAGTSVVVQRGTGQWLARIGGTFADAPPGQLVVLPDAFGRLQVAVHAGDATRVLGGREGGEVVIRAPTPPGDRSNPS